MAPAEVRNEQVKLLATVGAGTVAPIVGFFIGTLEIDDPLRLASFVVICLVVGGALLRIARLILEDLV